MTDDKPKAKEVRIPRRGALPSPESEIEKAPSFDPTKSDTNSDRNTKKDIKEESGKDDNTNK